MLKELVGSKVFIRTVTNYYTGELLGADDTLLHLGDAAWVADTGRFHRALAEGPSALNEVEPFPADCYVGLGAVIDISAWNHELPRDVK